MKLTAAVNTRTRQVHSTQEILYANDFAWVLLQPISICLKPLCHLDWKIFRETMVELHSFKSLNAKAAAKKLSHHHKGMTLARIVYQS